MTIRDNKPRASAPTEDDIMHSVNDVEMVVTAEPVSDPYTAGSNVNVPFAQATTVEPQRSEPNRSAKVPIAYSTGSPPQPPIATATGSPVIRATGQPPTTRARRNNNQDCCNERNCCCYVTSIVLAVVFICCVLPFIIFFIIAAVAGVSSINDGDVLMSDDNWNDFNDDFVAGNGANFGNWKNGIYNNYGD